MLTSGSVGWLLGPFLGNAVFGLRYRRLGGEIAEVGVSFLVPSPLFPPLGYGDILG